MYKKIFSMFVISCIVLIGILGAFTVDMASSSGHSSCPISMLSGSDCSNINNAIAVTVHHVSGFSQLTLSIINIDLSVLFISLILFVMLSFAVYKKDLLQYGLSSYRKVNRTYTAIHIPIIQSLIKWLVIRNEKAYAYARQGVWN